MQAWQYHAPGPLQSTLKLNPSAPRPSPSSLTPGQVLIKPIAAGLNPADFKGRGDRVLINGATGGVGIFSVQVAKLLGCRVTATASTGRGVELARELGADTVIDYRQTDVVSHLKGKGEEYDLIVDNVGDGPGDLFSSSRTYLGLGKPYVFAGGRMTMRSVFNLITAAVVPTALGGVKGRLVTFVAKDNAEDLERLLKWKAEGKLRIVVDSTFEFKDAKVAFEHLKAGGVKGKVIVKASPDQ
uniref:Enoyl reductase (ER) domain-containing protein n=1 Tax=Bionectria ochroleuca TaxID=29856 RepID=A0A0B7KI04_BIOOC